MSAQEQLGQMKTGEVRERAEKAGVESTGEMNKQEMLEALEQKGEYSPTDTEHGGGQRQKDPAPQDASPEDYKNIPGNQT